METSDPDLDLDTEDLDTGIPGLLDIWIWTSGFEGHLAYMNYNDNM